MIEIREKHIIKLSDSEVYPADGVMHCDAKLGFDGQNHPYMADLIDFSTYLDFFNPEPKSFAGSRYEKMADKWGFDKDEVHNTWMRNEKEQLKVNVEMIDNGFVALTWYALEQAKKFGSAIDIFRVLKATVIGEGRTLYRKYGPLPQ